jgi:hypothetical protein
VFEVGINKTREGGVVMAGRKQKPVEGAEVWSAYEGLTPDELDAMLAEGSEPWLKPSGYLIDDDVDDDDGN